METIYYLRKLNNNNDTAAGFPTIGNLGDIHDHKTQLVQLAFVAGLMILCCVLIGWALYRCDTDPNGRNPRQYGLQDPSSAASNSANNRMDLKQRQAYVAKALVVKHVIREETSSSSSTSSNEKNLYHHHRPRHAKIPKGEDIVFSEDDIKDLDNTLASTQSPWMCAICLTAYRIGDEICWSPTSPDCLHVFHLECIQEWLWKQEHCPCCRLAFLNFGSQGNDNDNKNEPDHVEDQPSTMTAARTSTAFETNSNVVIDPNDHNNSSATVTVTTLSTDVTTGEMGERVQQDEESGNPPELPLTPTTGTPFVDTDDMTVSLSFPIVNDNGATRRKVAASGDLENPIEESQPNESIMEDTSC